MPVEVFASGTLSTTGSNTEDFVSSPNEPGTYVLDVDRNAQAAGHVIELRVYKMVLSGGTARVAYYERFDIPPPTNDKIAISVPVSTPHSVANALRFSIACNTAAVSLPWCVTKIS